MNTPRSLANSCPYMRLTPCAFTQALSQRSRSNQYLAASGRKVSKRYRRPWLWRCGGKPWVENGFAEPISKILCTASLIRRGAKVAISDSLIARGTFNADMEVIIMPIHRTNLGKPGSVSFGFTTKCFFDRCVDENPLDLWLLCRRSNDERMTWRPDLLDRHRGGRAAPSCR